MADNEIHDMLIERRDTIRRWLQTEPTVPELEQAHLDSGSREQAYWNHGYQSALDDVIRLLTDACETCSPGRSLH